MNNKKKIEDEINFKNLLKNPLRLYGWFFLIVFVVILIGGIYYVKHLDAIYLNSTPTAIFAIDSVKVEEIPMKKGGIKPALDLSLVKSPSPEMLKKGKELFETTCSSCHGKEGKGDGPAGAALNPKPRNFHSDEGWVNGKSILGMFKTISEGIKGTGMSSYDYIPPKDRISIIHYIRTFGNYPGITDDAVSKLDETYHLSAGTVEPNTIPLELAIKDIIKENKPLIEKTNKIADEIKKSSDNNAKLFKSLTSNLTNSIYAIEEGSLLKDFNAFKNKIFADPLDLGFNSAILRLSDKQLKSLFDYLKNLTSKTVS